MAVREEQTERLGVQLYRRVTPRQSILVAAGMFEDGITVVRPSIPDRHPDISPEKLRARIRQRMLPRGLAEQATAARDEDGPQ